MWRDVPIGHAMPCALPFGIARLRSGSLAVNGDRASGFFISCFGVIAIDACRHLPCPKRKLKK